MIIYNNNNDLGSGIYKNDALVPNNIISQRSAAVKASPYALRQLTTENREFLRKIGLIVKTK